MENESLDVISIVDAYELDRSTLDKEALDIAIRDTGDSKIRVVFIDANRYEYGPGRIYRYYVLKAL